MRRCNRKWLIRCSKGRITLSDANVEMRSKYLRARFTITTKTMRENKSISKPPSTCLKTECVAMSAATISASLVKQSPTMWVKIVSSMRKRRMQRSADSVGLSSRQIREATFARRENVSSSLGGAVLHSYHVGMDAMAEEMKPFIHRACMKTAWPKMNP
jgi:hypothetical protein